MSRRRMFALSLLSFAMGALAGSVMPTIQFNAPAEPTVTRSTWCPTPEQRASAPAFVTDSGSVVEEVPLAPGGPDAPR